MGCHFGGGASWLSTPLLSLLSHGKGSPDGGTGGMRGLLGCPPQQGASLPRTRCQWPLPFSGFGLRNWRSLGPRNVHLSTPPRQSPGKTSPTNPPTSGVHSSPAPLVCHADSRSSYCLRRHLVPVKPTSRALHPPSASFSPRPRRRILPPGDRPG